MEELKAYIQETLPELKELIIELCGIPAPSHHEDKRAEFCRDCSGMGNIMKTKASIFRSIKKKSVFTRAWKESNLRYTPLCWM